MEWLDGKVVLFERTTEKQRLSPVKFLRGNLYWIFFIDQFTEDDSR